MQNRRSIGVLILFLVSAAALVAQLGVGTITGRVTDSTGAVIPGASITIVNQATNFRFESRTNDEGVYRVPSLQPGKYVVTIEAEGFRSQAVETDLRTGATVPVNAELELGQVTEQVQVRANANLIATESAAAGDSLTGEVMYKLPNYQRYAASTMNFIGGISTGGYAYGGGLGNYHVAGQRSSAIGAFDDGVVSNNQTSGTGYVKPVLNTVEEIKVITTVAPAEYGHSGGGIIDVVKKTGTNQFHGLASLYGRSRRMQHRLFFDKYKTSQPQPSGPNGVGNMFLLPDFNLSGPIIKNRTFFIIGYQHLIEKKSAQAFGTVPTPAMLGGDFNFGGVGQQLFDPSTTRLVNGAWVRDPIPNNIIPQSRIDPVARNILALNPWFSPNLPIQYNAQGPLDNLLYNEPARVFFHDWSGRVDHQFNPSTKMFFSMTTNSSEGLSRFPRNLTIPDFDGGEGVTNPSKNSIYNLGGTWIVNPTMISDTRIGYNRWEAERQVAAFGENWPDRLGIPNVNPILMPSLGSGNRNDPSSIYGIVVSGPNRRVDETLSFRTDLTKIWGTHSFKVGYEWMRFRLNSYEEQFPSGQFFFDNMTAGLQPGGQPVPNTGNTFAGFLLGSVRQAQFTTQLAGWHPRSSINSFYMQDDWKLTPRITLNLGVRYSLESQFDTKYGRQSNFSPTATDPVTGRQGAIVHPNQPLAPSDKNNFQPRVGMAWNFSDKWVFRSGFGVNTIDIKFPQTRGNFQEYVAVANQQQLPGDPRPLYKISQVPSSPAFGLAPDGSSPFQGQNFSARNVEWWSQDLVNPYVMNWAASVQRQLGQNYVIELNYQGSSGVSLVERWNQNIFPIDIGQNDPALRQAVFNAPQNYRPYPHFGDIFLRCNCGHSSYHGGTAKFERRMSSGVQFLTFYTFSKALNQADTDNDGGGVAPLTNRNLEKGLASYHRAHHWVGEMLYELPFGPGKPLFNTQGFAKHLIGGWSIAFIQTADSGNPMNMTFAGSPFNYFPTWVAERRPDAAVDNPGLYSDYRDRVRNSPDRFTVAGSNPILDINQFAYPEPFTPGNLGRNVVIGPGLLWSQVSAAKDVYIGERVRVNFRWDMQNAFKTYNFNVDTITRTYNPRTAANAFGKVRSDPRTASIGGQPLMNLTLAIHF